MTASTPGSSTAELLQAVSADLSALVRQELQRAQQELADKARQAGKAGAMLGGAAVLGTLAVGTSAALLLRLLERRFGRTTAALLATGLYAGGAGALAATALERLRQVWPLVPQDTVTSLRQDVGAASSTATTGTPTGPTAGGTAGGPRPTA
jgi:Putative Actinobacterial Holin-X, holin superfamily III